MKIFSRGFYSFVCIALSLSCTAQTGTSLTADEFGKSVTDNHDIQLLDVRTPAEFFSGHIKNALQADWNDKDEFNRRIGFVDKNKPVYVYCLAGGRSAAAAEKMRNMGYKNVYELKGGINSWKAANKALEGKSTEKQLSIETFNKAITGSKIVLVDVGATWCPPCIMMQPILKSLQNNNPRKFVLIKVFHTKINQHENRQLEC